jgi:hypothetical protein
MLGATQIGVITQLQADLVEKSSAVQEAKKELSEAQQASAEEKQAVAYEAARTLGVPQPPC